MERSRTVAATKKLIREYYEFGNVIEISRMLTDDAIAFGIKSEEYVVGKYSIERFCVKCIDY